MVSNSERKYVSPVTVGESALCLFAPPSSRNLHNFGVHIGQRASSVRKLVVLLDEIVEQVTDMAKSSMTLKFYDGDVRYTARQDDGMIVVSEGA